MPDTTSFQVESWHCTDTGGTRLHLHGFDLSGRQYSPETNVNHGTILFSWNRAPWCDDEMSPVSLSCWPKMLTVQHSLPVLPFTTVPPLIIKESCPPFGQRKSASSTSVQPHPKAPSKASRVILWFWPFPVHHVDSEPMLPLVS